ncbi:hypothetical protein J27TS7_57940 [Paenibacillus dendritiformis]|uniref:hypothetical protein n=1 Tax=Paenibacillus dendritiformis TaxID=130049 RepID=UPI001B0D3BA3|nr:hypothetical protein [Paenibacillus dendritiformis]GIO76280.1 hypothetical protein J27TS7_57940 [Paenibacillus dendritiformis]
MPEQQPAARDWQSEFQKKSECYDELKAEYARTLCEYHSLKANFYELAKKCGSAESREKQLNEFIQKLLDADDISFLVEGHIRWKDQARRTLDQVYGTGAP